MSQVSLTVVPDGDGVWQLHAEVRTDAFSGRGWCWADPAWIEEFAALLTAYPMPTGLPAELRLGYGSREGDDLRVSLSIQAFGRLGALEVRTEVADHDDPSCRLKAKFMTGYAALDRFVPQLRRLVAGDATEAALIGD